MPPKQRNINKNRRGGSIEPVQPEQVVAREESDQRMLRSGTTLSPSPARTASDPPVLASQTASSSSGSGAAIVGSAVAAAAARTAKAVAAAEAAKVAAAAASAALAVSLTSSSSSASSAMARTAERDPTSDSGGRHDDADDDAPLVLGTMSMSIGESRQSETGNDDDMEVEQGATPTGSLLGREHAPATGEGSRSTNAVVEQKRSLMSSPGQRAGDQGRPPLVRPSFAMVTTA
jgi:hypothetical protein